VVRAWRTPPQGNTNNSTLVGVQCGACHARCVYVWAPPLAQMLISPSPLVPLISWRRGVLCVLPSCYPAICCHHHYHPPTHQHQPSITPLIRDAALRARSSAPTLRLRIRLEPEQCGCPCSSMPAAHTFPAAVHSPISSACRRQLEHVAGAQRQRQQPGGSSTRQEELCVVLQPGTPQRLW
jgi:hypothetical protein